MASAQEVADEAESRITKLSEGDMDLLFHAAEIVRDQTRSTTESPHAIEHLAFSLITSAHSSARKEAATDTPAQ